MSLNYLDYLFCVFAFFIAFELLSCLFAIIRKWILKGKKCSPSKVTVLNLDHSSPIFFDFERTIDLLEEQIDRDSNFVPCKTCHNNTVKKCIDIVYTGLMDKNDLRESGFDV